MKNLDKKRDTDTRELASKLFCIGFLVLCAYLVLRYAFGALFPFIVAYLVSLAIIPLAKKTSQKTKIPKKLCAAVYITFAIALIVFLAVLSVARLVREAEALVSGGEGTLEGMKKVVDTLKAPLEWIRERINADDAKSLLDGRFEELIPGIEKRAVDAISNSVAKIISVIVTHTPSIFIGIAVTVMSCYYFCMDGTLIGNGIKKMLPQKYRGNITRIVSLIKTAIKRYARAYLVLMLITFVEVFLGLLLLNVKYAFIIALGVAAVDLLPLLGAGAVLLPWALVVFLMGDTTLALGLVILYGVITVIRQITEPHIVGTSIGLHPAVSLFSMYFGYKMFGFLGMILGPAVAFVISEAIKREE